jgi:hypothetical protein
MSQSIDKFNAYYLQHVAALLYDWRKHHPLIRACQPLRADLHTSINDGRLDRRFEVRGIAFQPSLNQRESESWQP